MDLCLINGLYFSFSLPIVYWQGYGNKSQKCDRKVIAINEKELSQ